MRLRSPVVLTAFNAASSCLESSSTDARLATKSTLETSRIQNRFGHKPEVRGLLSLQMSTWERGSFKFLRAILLKTLLLTSYCIEFLLPVHKITAQKPFYLTQQSFIRRSPSFKNKSYFLSIDCVTNFHRKYICFLH